MRQNSALNTLERRDHVYDQAQGSESKHVTDIVDSGVYSCSLAFVRLCMHIFAASLVFAACAHLTVFTASVSTRRPSFILGATAF